MKRMVRNESLEKLYGLMKRYKMDDLISGLDKIQEKAKEANIEGDNRTSKEVIKHIRRDK